MHQICQQLEICAADLAQPERELPLDLNPAALAALGFLGDFGSALTKDIPDLCCLR